jgi:hypothetical protein
MFEITPDDIAKLDDVNLRTLIGLLCEAEMRSRGCSTSGVTWGGDQNAKDGGVDVRVSAISENWGDGFIPRRCTGFQVKRQDMPRRAIVGEMRPRGKLRPVIRELAENGGAYILVSSLGATSDSALASRREAIVEATGELAGQLYVDFYDRTRIATWVRSYPGLVAWTRKAIGRAIQGWQGYGAWAYPAGGVEADYLLDDDVRIRERASGHDADSSAGDGLLRVRAILRKQSSVVRLVGLSGVGKTRFVQALFDDRVGDEALDSGLAVYTNMSDDPDPQPVKLASDLIANRARAVMIIDNCPSDLHARLSELVNSQGSCVSVVTVEYDIKDDLPEGTEVFEIRAASVNLIERLLQQRFPRLSGIDVRTAAEFSSGNARIAIALAGTVSRSGSLAKLSDGQLFERLFTQRQVHDQSLLEIAGACSLVYSFDGENFSDEPAAELQRIAGLAGSSPERAHRQIAELMRRELAQRRGRWRAILPQALANHLAARALEDIPLARLESALVNGAPERLTISFARRLGYLETSVEARRIVAGWFAPTGWIGQNIWDLNEFGQAVFRNCLPAAPDVALSTLETNKPRVDRNSKVSLGSVDYIARTLRSLAWEAKSFERCTAILQFLALDGGLNEARKLHTSLFPIQLSGTHAVVEQRAQIARKLLQSGDAGARELGLSALVALLRCSYFTSHYDFQFGSHSRDYGYQPQTRADVSHWFREVLSLASEFALTANPVEFRVREIIATSFRGLWAQSGLHDELEDLSKRLAEREFWAAGWRAVKQTRVYDEKDKHSDNYARLSALETALRPRNLVQRIRARVFHGGGYDLDDVDPTDSTGIGRAIQRQDSEVEALAAEFVGELATTDELMPEIFSSSGGLWQFGIGIARASKDPKGLWDRMVAGAARVEESERDVRVLSGFLLELANQKSPMLDAMLDQALENDVLASRFTHLQPPVSIVPDGLVRLKKSLCLGKVPIARYADVHFGKAVETLPPGDIADFILALSNVEGGTPIAIGILARQFFSDVQDKRPHAVPIMEAGRSILAAIDFTEVDASLLKDHEFQQVLNVCIAEKAGRSTAGTLCHNMRNAKLQQKLWDDCHEMLKVLAQLQPIILLSTLSSGDSTAVATGANMLRRASLFGENPFEGVSDEIILKWCTEGSADRYRFAACVAVISDASLNRWRPIAMRLVHDGPDPAGVMTELIARLQPISYSESRSTIIRGNAALLAQFDTRGNPSLASLIQSKHEELIRDATDDEAYESKRDRERDERFE